jgi:hypothetical protein
MCSELFMHLYIPRSAARAGEINRVELPLASEKTLFLLLLLELSSDLGGRNATPSVVHDMAVGAGPESRRTHSVRTV